MEHPRVTPVPERSTILIAGQELVMALGRPSECNKFDDLVDRFLKAALVCGKDYDRIDVAFDGYREAIFPFHALTGCDTVSFFAKHTLFFFYKNTFYKNIEAEICEILRIFYE